jgi:heat shock protein HslJ
MPHLKPFLRPFPRFLSLYALLGSVLTGCAQVMPPCGAVNAPPIQDISGTQWQLIRWHYTSPNDQKTRHRSIPYSENKSSITLDFSSDGKTVSGFAGCNRFTAQVQLGDRGFTLEKIASTRKACSPPLDQLEYKLLSYLSDYRTMVRDGDRLLIMTRDQEVLSFALKN